jgi:hypothetical protein
MTCKNTSRMVGAFLVQMILVASLFALSEHFSLWVLRIMIAAALLLPVVAYLTIFVQPLVYRAWRSALLELWHLGTFYIVALLGCFRLKSIVRLCRSVVSLRAFPVTSDERVALLLFPFKVFVLMALPFLWLSCSFVRLVEPQLRYVRFPEAMLPITECYVLCLAILLFGALVQALFSHRGRSSQTVFVFLLGIVLLWMFRPWGMIVR